MTAHTCVGLTDGCYRCELNRDEIESIEREVASDAQKAWLAYRDDYMRTHYLSKKQASSQMRRRDFIEGYKAANR